MLGNSKNISPGGHLLLAKKVDLERLPVQAKFKLNLISKKNSTTLIHSNSKVFVRPVGRAQNGVQAYEVTPFTRKKNIKLTQPETWLGGEIELGETYTIRTDSPKKYFDFNQQHYLRHAAPLFPESDSPKISEVAQRLLENCFLLAAIQAILNHPDGEAFIRGMFYQHDDGTVTVRLYNPSLEVFEYIRMNNEILVNNSGSLNKHTASWVYVLESAYALMEQRCGNKDNSAVSAVYAGGGYSNYALTVLTGLPGHRHLSCVDVCNLSSFIDKDGLTNLRKKLAEIAKYDEVKQCQLFFEEHFTRAEKKLQDYFGVDEPFEAQGKFFKLLVFYTANQKRYDKIIEKKDLSYLTDDESDIADILAPVLLRVGRKPAFPEEYQRDELAVYQAIEDALGDGCLVTASSQSNQGIVRDMQKAYNGVITGHAYTVLRVFEKEMKVRNEDGEIVDITAKYVTLRNPWGRMGRSYEQDESTLEHKAKYDVSADTFDVELNDFCHFFPRYGVNDSANALFAYDRKKELCLWRVLDTVNEWDVHWDGSVDSLIQTKRAYQACEEDLLDLALQELTLLGENLHLSLSGVMMQDFDDESQRRDIFDMTVVAQFIETQPVVDRDEPEEDNDESDDDKHPFHWIVGDKAAVCERLYLLFSYQALKAASEVDEEQLAELGRQILATTLKPEGWDILTQQRLMCGAIIDARRRSYLGDIKDVESQCERLADVIKEFRSYDGKGNSNDIGSNIAYDDTGNNDNHDDIEALMTTIVLNEAILTASVTRLKANEARYIRLEPSVQGYDLDDVVALFDKIDLIPNIQHYRELNQDTIQALQLQGATQSLDGKLAPSLDEQLSTMQDALSLTIEGNDDDRAQLNEVLRRYKKKGSPLSLLFKPKDNNNNYNDGRKSHFIAKLNAILVSLASYITSLLNTLGDSGQV